MQIKIEKIVFPGKSLFRHEGKAGFTDEGLPEEIVEVAIVKEHPRFTEAITTKVITPSPYRVKPRCDHHKACSPYQYIDYLEQLKIKNSQAQEIFSRLNIVPEPIVPSPQQWEYRNKINFKLLRGKNGFFSAYNIFGRHDKFVPAEHCFLADKEMNEITGTVIKVLNTHGITGVEEITIRKSIHANASLLTLNAGKGFDTTKFTKAFDPRMLNGGSAAAIFYENNKAHIIQIAGANAITQKCAQMLYKIGPLSFFQINTPAIDLLIADLKKDLDLSPNDTLADIYCGVGTFEIALGRNCKKIIFVENDPENTKLIEDNLKLNKIDNAGVYFSNGENMSEIFREMPTTVIIDPPRSGISKPACEQLMRLKPERLVYIACDPASLSRDLGELTKVYQTQRIRTYDLFPQTPHFESYAVLNRR